LHYILVAMNGVTKGSHKSERMQNIAG